MISYPEPVDCGLCRHDAEDHVPRAGCLECPCPRDPYDTEPSADALARYLNPEARA